MTITPEQRKNFEKTIQTPELENRDTLLETLDRMLKDSKRLAKKDRWNGTRVQRLRVLETHLRQYQELLMDQQVTLRQMQVALNNELKVVGDRQEDRER